MNIELVYLEYKDQGDDTKGNGTEASYFGHINLVAYKLLFVIQFIQSSYAKQRDRLMFDIGEIRIQYVIKLFNFASVLALLKIPFVVYLVVVSHRSLQYDADLEECLQLHEHCTTETELYQEYQEYLSEHIQLRNESFRETSALRLIDKYPLR